MILRIRWVCVTLAVVLTGFSIRTAAAQSTSSIAVAIEPANVSVAAGQTVDVAIVVHDVSDLYAFDAQVSFDPNVVQVVDVDPALNGTQVALGLFLEPGFVIRNQADNTAGTLQLAMTQLNPSVAKSGTGNLAVFKLRGVKAGGTSPLTLQVQLAQRDGTPLATTPASGQVQVINTPATGPTNTPIPTQGAGTPLPTGTVQDVEPIATATPVVVRVVEGSTITPQPSNTPTAMSIASTTAEINTPASSATLAALSTATAVIAQPINLSTPSSEAVTTPSTVEAAAAQPVVQPAAQVTAEPPTKSANNAGSPSVGLVLLAGVIGLIGIVVLVVMGRQGK